MPQCEYVKTKTSRSQTESLGWTAPLALSPPLFSGHETGNDDIYEPINNIPGESRFHKHRITKLLGAGAFGRVYLTKIQTGQNYAVKVIDIGDETKEDMMTEEEAKKEFSITKEMIHNNIIKCFTSWIERRVLSVKFYIVMEYCANGTLKKAIEDGSHIEHRWFLAKQLVDPLNFMHERGIAHCDLKTDNILIDDQYHVKICDFGNAEILYKSTYSSGRGIVYTGHNAHLVKNDIKDIGRVLFQLCHGPFDTDDDLDQAIYDFAYSNVTPTLEKDTEDIFPRQDQLVKLLIKGELTELPKPKPQTNMGLDQDHLTESQPAHRHVLLDQTNPSVKSPVKEESLWIVAIVLLLVCCAIVYLQNSYSSVINIILEIFATTQRTQQYEAMYRGILEMAERVN